MTDAQTGSSSGESPQQEEAASGVSPGSDRLGATGGDATGDSGSPSAPDPEGRPFTRNTRFVLGAATGLVLAGALVLRFWTKSDLWFDEALTVSIAKQPIHDLAFYLRRDGAPPLYYVLLHFWMGIFGTSDIGVRSLSGVIGVATMPLVWVAGRRIGGRSMGWAAMMLVATSPFAVRYDTENRMYALVALLTVLGFLAIDSALRRPRPGNLMAVAVVTGLLLYSHYWSIYLVGVTGIWLLFQAWRGRPEWRRGAWAATAALAVGCLTFLPWVPIFLFQSAHTGTPWATPANFAAMVNAVTSFAGGGSSQGRALALIYFALVGLGVFGVAVDRQHIDLDIRTRPLGRPLGLIVVGTLATAIAGGFISTSAFDPRYASVVFVPLILLVSIGLFTFLDRRIRLIVLGVAIVAGIGSAIPNITTNRTQAGEVATALATRARPGDIVAYCPDQLGPAVSRLLPNGRYRQITFPRGTSPIFINWVDYAKAVAAASPTAFAGRLEAEAAATRQVFVVWDPGYQTFGTECERLVETVQGDPRYETKVVLNGRPTQFFQPMYLYQFTPTKP